MTKERAGIFDAEDDFDVSGFAPKTKPTPDAGPAQVRAVSEAANFHSREPHSPAQMMQPSHRAPRRHRTGRNVQLNIKARAEAIEAFYAIADRHGWVLGEAFERAIAALQREFP